MNHEQRWTETDTERFAELRLQAFDHSLTAAEQGELTHLQQRFDLEEERQMTATTREQVASDERFNELRLKKLADGLFASEQAELNDMLATRLQMSDDFFEPVLAWLDTEQSALRKKLIARQAESEALAQLLLQQEQLTVDATAWLAEFDRRSYRIHQTYTHLTGEQLAA